MSIPLPPHAAWLGVCLALLVGCKSQPSGTQEPADGPDAHAPLTLAVQAVQLQPHTQWQELPARVVAQRSAEVRPQVSGLIRARLFEEGSLVRAGQVLYRLDDSAYRSAVLQARAQLQSARARVQSLEATAKRQSELVAMGMLSRQAFEDSESALQQARAEAQATQAQLSAAQVQLDLTELRAPISGRIGRSLVNEGALAVQSQEQALAHIVQLDQVAIDMQRPALSDNAHPERHAAVRLRLEDGQLYAHEGRLKFSETLVDPASGAVTLRAHLANPEGRLLPGMFVRAELAIAHYPAAVLLPFQALQTPGDGSAKVWVLGPRQALQERTVQVVAQGKGHWLVHQGLREGEQVLLEGTLRVQPGQVVKPIAQQTRTEKQS